MSDLPALDRYGKTLVFSAAPTPTVEEVRATDLLAPDVLRSHVRAHAEHLGTPDLAVAASSWGKHYAAALLPGVLATLTLHDAGLDADAASASVQLEGGVPRAIRLLDPAPHRGEDVRPWTWARLLGGHLAPLFAALHGATGLARGVLWGSAGNYCAWLYDHLEAEHPDRDAVREDRAALLEASHVPGLPGPNPLRNPVCYERLGEPDLPERVQVRRTCCLKDRIPGKPACYSCPRLTRQERIDLLRKLEVRR